MSAFMSPRELDTLITPSTSCTKYPDACAARIISERYSSYDLPEASIVWACALKDPSILSPAVSMTVIASATLFMDGASCAFNASDVFLIDVSMRAILSVALSVEPPTWSINTRPASRVAESKACFASVAVSWLAFFPKVSAYFLFASSTFIVSPRLSRISGLARLIPNASDSYINVVSPNVGFNF